MSSKDYFRPRGDITTVLDLTDRDSQDNTYSPLNTENSWFHRDDHSRVYPTTISVQEFTQRGPAQWGQKFSFEIGSLSAGDLLQSVMLQIQLGSWYNDLIINRLSKAEITTDTTTYQNDYWTFCNSLGISIIEYADFIVNDQTIERLTGEFIRTFYNTYADVNNLFGISSDSLGSIPYSYLSTSVVNQTAFNPNRPFPTENGTYFCILPFFFLRTRLKEVFPLLSCNEGNVRIDVKLRPFDQVVRKYIGYRSTCQDTPLKQTVHFVTTTPIPSVVSTTTLTNPPEFKDFRIVTCCSLTSGSIRQQFLHQPFEQMVKLVQSFSFEEPLKYLVSKPNPNSDTVEIQLPLELNNPVVELLWVFRRKAVLINNEWTNYTPAISLEATPEKVFPEWLDYATIRLNGSELISASGNWFREHIASVHSGGLISYSSYIYGYSFSRYPDDHQPSGTANMSRTTSVTLNLRVNTPISKDLSTLSPSCQFDPNTVGGWEVFVYAIYYNWLRFENGICNRIFTD
jgi:Large eukaryotic DNA virus major capsid protein/Major capsid protein N-terminus